MGLREEILGKYLKTTASGDHFIPTLDSYLYSNYNITKGKEIKFILRTVDLDGRSIPYDIQGETLVGLKLLINPASLSVNLSKIINRTQTMTGWIEDNWGEELDTITFQGSGAAFIWKGPSTPFTDPKFGTPLTQSHEEVREMMNKYMGIPDLNLSGPVQPGNRTGLTVQKRRETLSYDMFRKVIKMMNANAATYDTNGLVKERLYIEVSYDYSSYRGYFESVDITEDSENPFRFIYTITFKSEKTVYNYLR